MSRYCSDLESTSTDHSYEYLVESQPIGKELFHQFCAQDTLLARCTQFLKELTSLELLVDEKYAASAPTVFCHYLAEKVRLPMVTEEMAATVDADLSTSPVPRDVFAPCKE